MRYAIILLAAVAQLALAGNVDMSLFKAAQSREDSGWHNTVYEKYVDQLQKAAGLKPPEKDWILDNYQLLHSLRYIVSRAKIDDESGPMLSSRFGFSIPAGLFSTFHDQLKSVYMDSLDLSDTQAEALADVPEQEAVELARIHYDDYRQAIGRGKLNERDLKKNIKSSLEDLYKSTKVVDPRFDIPFVAGYDVNDEKYIFIDRHVEEFFNGSKNKIPVWKFLNLHERVEKAVLDAFQVNYQTAHQIALRSEHRSAWAVGVDWKTYNFPMGGLIDHIGDEKPTSVSNRLDMLPYYSYSDEDSIELVREMLKAMVADKPLQ